MGTQGFLCGQCQAELVAAPDPVNLDGRLGWTPPVLCCGQALRLRDTGEGSALLMIPGSVARCPRCGYQVRVVVQSESSLICMPCQTEMIVISENPKHGTM